MDAKVPGLDQLKDIVLPPAPPLWPPTPELAMLLLLLAATGLVIWAQWRRARRANAYRVAALALLEEAGSVHDVSVVLKRAALAVYSREQVASLHGADWAAFLSRTGGGDYRSITDVPPSDAATPELVALAAGRIRCHRRERLAAHLDYISRNGDNEVFDHQGVGFSNIGERIGLSTQEAMHAYGRAVASVADRVHARRCISCSPCPRAPRRAPSSWRPGTS